MHSHWQVSCGQGQLSSKTTDTEDLIDEELVALGIPQDKICLGLLPPDVRDYITQQNHERPARLNVPALATSLGAG